MGLPKNRTNNPNGRPKGSKNKTSEAIREKILSLLENNLQNIETDLNELKPRERLRFIVSILPYAVPKLNNIIQQDTSTLTREDLTEMFDKLFAEQ